MRFSFKLSIAFSQLLFCISLEAQLSNKNSLIEQTPNTQKVAVNINQEALWDLALSFDVTALSGSSGNAGAEWDGTYFYSTRWASNLIHKYNSTGTALIDEFSIPGVSGLRDLAFDGTYMYGGAAANTIYQMDFNTKTLIGTISSPVAVRFIAYDEVADAFWVGDWSSPAILVSRSGTILASFSTGLTGQYGAAYENISWGGIPSLWIFDQGGGAGTPQLIHQFDITTGTATGIVHDVTFEFPNANGIAGGLFIMIDWQLVNLTVGGILQGTPDNMFVYDVLPCSIPPPHSPIPQDGAENISINLSQLQWHFYFSNADITTELYFGTDPNNLTLVQSGALDTLWNIDPSLLPLDYYTTYYWKVLEVVPNCNTWGPLWHFQTEEDPTPVELTSFTAQSVSYGVVLNWSTATETNNQGFEIERKQSVGNFEEIGFVAGFGTTTEPKSYSFKDANLEYGTYIYRLKQIDYDGTFSNSCEVSIVLDILLDYSLEQNYPNPFNPSTKIQYQVSSITHVTLKVYDILGNEIATLVDEFKPAGSYEVEFNPVSSIKNPASGIYFYQIRAENFVQTKKMLLVK